MLARLFLAGLIVLSFAGHLHGQPREARSGDSPPLAWRPVGEAATPVSATAESEVPHVNATISVAIGSNRAKKLIVRCGFRSEILSRPYG